jgi:endoglucanase
MPRFSRALRALSLFVVVTAFVAVLTPAIATDAGSKSMDIFMRFHIKKPNEGALKQIVQALLRGKFRDAELLLRLVTVPQATWLTGGEPAAVAKQVRDVLLEARLQRRVPVFVLYNIPLRDCSGLSAGGAQTSAEYAAWIDAISGAIGSRDAVVMLEPDGLALMPMDCGQDPTGTLTAERFDQLRYAIQALKALSNTRVYLDAGHSNWHSVGAIAGRLDLVGVRDTQGFYLNPSNYQPTAQQIQYGTWISKCIAFANDDSEGGWRLGHFDFCASQYFPANAEDFSTWNLTDAWYDANMSSGSVATTHFVVDTSRNGQVHASNSPSDPTFATKPPGRMTLYAQPPFNQAPATIATLTAGSWCNLRGAGAGPRPTTSTGAELVDAFVWIKTVGESDGQCSIGAGQRAWDFSLYSQPGWPTSPAAQGTFDPLWGRANPAAGAGFPEQALELARLAAPAL